MLFLRTCDEDGKSYGGFVWNTEVGAVNIAPDWRATSECGNGLHGLLNGQGNVNLLSSDPSAIWLVVEADDSIDLGGNHKFQECVVRYSGNRDEAVQYLVDRGCTGVHFSTVSGGDYSTVSGGVGATVSGDDYSTVSGGVGATVSGGVGAIVSGGDYSTISGGDGSTVSGGDRSTVSGGYESIVTGGYGSTVAGGDKSSVTGGYGSSVSGGNWSTVSGGDKSTVTGGYSSIVSGGDKSTVTGEDSSSVSGGDKSTVSGGLESVLILHYYDANFRQRVVTAYVGENGIEPNTKYRLNAQNEFEKVE